MVRPNLFLLGLPKCGTSSIANVLATHPAVLGSAPKETFFLVDRDSPFYNTDSYHAIGDAGWSKFFTGSKDASNVRYFMDATTHMAFQKSAPAVLEKYENCKLLIVLREPAERIYSSFNYTKFNLGFIDNDVTFSKYAKDLMDDNHSMNYIRNESSRYVLSHELLYSDYSQVLECWKFFYDQGRLYIAVFEEMKDNAEHFYAKIFDWLNLPGAGINNLPRNQTYRPANLRLHRILVFLNGLARRMPGAGYLKKMYFKQMTTKINTTSEDLEAMAKLRAYYQVKNKIVAENYKVDISRWN